MLKSCVPRLSDWWRSGYGNTRVYDVVWGWDATATDDDLGVRVFRRVRGPLEHGEVRISATIFDNVDGETYADLTGPFQRVDQAVNAVRREVVRLGLCREQRRGRFV